MILDALVVLLFCAPGAQDQNQEKNYSAMAARVTVTLDEGTKEKVKSDPAWKELVEWLDDREQWTKILKELDGTLGLVPPEGIPIDVTVSSKQGVRASIVGTARSRAGKLDINLPAMMHAATQFNEKPSFVLKLGLLHELTHCFQQTAEGKEVKGSWPRWLTEGMACLAADDPLQNKQAQAALKEVADLDEVADAQVPYRGLMFFKYVLERVKREKLKQFVQELLREGENVKTADDVGRVLGKFIEDSWENVKTREQRWSERYLEKIK